MSMMQKKSIRILALIFVFVIGFSVFGHFFMRKMTDEQFAMCERIARDVYQQGDQRIIEAPNDIRVDVTATTITVNIDDVTIRGKVIARLQNGELVITRNEDTLKAYFISILVGILCLLVCELLFIVHDEKMRKKVY